MEKQFLLDLTIKNVEQNIEKLKKQESSIEVLYVITNTNIDIDKILNLQNYLIIEKNINWNEQYLTFVRHPYKSKIIDVEYINFCDEMLLAKENWDLMIEKLNKNWFWNVQITSTVYYKNWKLISDWTNSDYHLENWCVRKKMWCKSWEWYELCLWCQPINHSEQTGIRKAKKQW